MSELEYNENIKHKVDRLINSYSLDFDKKLLVSTGEKQEQMFVLKRLLTLRELIVDNKLNKLELSDYIVCKFKEFNDFEKIYRSVVMSEYKKYYLKEDVCYKYQDKLEIFTYSYNEFNLNEYIDVVNKGSERYIKLPFYFVKNDFKLLNDLKYTFKKINTNNKFFIIDSYKSIDDYLFYYICFKNNNINVGIEIKNINDVYKVIDTLKLDDDNKYFDCLILDLKSIYGERDYCYFKSVIISDIRLIRDLIYIKRHCLLIKMNGYENEKYIQRLRKSGFNNLYFE